MHTLVIILYIAIFISFFYAVLSVILYANKTSLQKLSQERFERIRNSEETQNWKYAKETQLLKHGVDVFILKDGFTLLKWYTTKALYAVVFALIVIFAFFIVGFNAWTAPIAIVVAIFGFFLPDILLYYQNSTSNKDMMADIMEMSRSVLYSNRGGQYITKAISDAMLVVSNERLKVAMLKLKYNIDSQKSLTRAINEFERHFENAEISAFCTVIRSLQETGQINDALQTLRSNIEREQTAVNKRKIQKLESKTQLNCMLVFTGIIICLVYILFMFVSSIVKGF